MSLTSYRAAPPRGMFLSSGCRPGLLLDCPPSRAGAAPPRDGHEAVFDRMRLLFLLGRPDGDLLSRVLGRSTIGAEGFHGRVRDGIGCIAPRNDHQVIEAEDVNDARAFARAGRCWIE